MPRCLCHTKAVLSLSLKIWPHSSFNQETEIIQFAPQRQVGAGCQHPSPLGQKVIPVKKENNCFIYESSIDFFQLKIIAFTIFFAKSLTPWKFFIPTLGVQDGGHPPSPRPGQGVPRLPQQRSSLRGLIPGHSSSLTCQNRNLYSHGTAAEMHQYHITQAATSPAVRQLQPPSHSRVTSQTPHPPQPSSATETPHLRI